MFLTSKIGYNFVFICVLAFSIKSNVISEYSYIDLADLFLKFDHAQF